MRRHVPGAEYAGQEGKPTEDDSTLKKMSRDTFSSNRRCICAYVYLKTSHEELTIYLYTGRIYKTYGIIF